jgi:hypothetical protein
MCEMCRIDGAADAFEPFATGRLAHLDANPTCQEETMISRRFFLGMLGASLTVRGRLEAEAEPLQAGEWGSPVFDLHFHMRPQAAANVAHLDGAGIAKANLLTRANAAEEYRAIDKEAPGRFSWFGSADIARPEGMDALTQAVKSGARGFESVLKANPKTMFIGHAGAVWANVSADFKNDAAYPSGPIVRGGVTDRLLGQYANLYGDLSANSGNNMLSRDADFTRDFLQRHQDKLMFGSDCFCSDGRGGGMNQGNPASRMFGKCIARETLTILKRSTTPEVFRKVTWDNAHKLLRLAPSAA